MSKKTITTYFISLLTIEKLVSKFQNYFRLEISLDFIGRLFTSLGENNTIIKYTRNVIFDAWAVLRINYFILFYFWTTKS